MCIPIIKPVSPPTHKSKHLVKAFTPSKSLKTSQTSSISIPSPDRIPISTPLPIYVESPKLLTSPPPENQTVKSPPLTKIDPLCAISPMAEDISYDEATISQRSFLHRLALRIYLLN
ncbi:unnamed protein product [Vicia faba]|uniref:Uncharacterized protein n=1 Tax=Vicia faba TaxID=3906 RepID=A0AAV1B829_VICFA|nr:unnamed protein product [Vicia faba]